MLPALMTDENLIPMCLSRMYGHLNQSSSWINRLEHDDNDYITGSYSLFYRNQILSYFIWGCVYIPTSKSIDIKGGLVWQLEKT